MMTKKRILTILFIISLLPMVLYQYGGCKGVQEISGLYNLYNPIGLTAAALYFVGVWVKFEYDRLNTLMSLLGVFGIVISELYTFYTWYEFTITGETSIELAMQFAFPEFYLGLAVSFIMIVAYVVISIRYKES